MNALTKLMRRIKGMLAGRVDYINGSDTLPPPLTRKEEEEVFLRLSGNDPEARTAEYYASRPCLRHVGEAAEIVDELLS